MQDSFRDDSQMQSKPIEPAGYSSCRDVKVHTVTSRTGQPAKQIEGIAGAIALTRHAMMPRDMTAGWIRGDKLAEHPARWWQIEKHAVNLTTFPQVLNVVAVHTWSIT